MDRFARFVILPDDVRVSRVETPAPSPRGAGRMRPSVPPPSASPGRAGSPAPKPRRFRALARWWAEHATAARALEDAALRVELLGIEGVGEETADAISLYCFARPAFLCDEYARRALTARGASVPAGYQAFRRAIVPALDSARFDVRELAELHGLIVEEGKLRARSAVS